MDDIPALGIEETAFQVEDLERSIAFYRDVLGLRLVTADKRFSPAMDQIPELNRVACSYFSVISRMSLLPMISRISRRFTAIACC